MTVFSTKEEFEKFKSTITNDSWFLVCIGTPREYPCLLVHMLCEHPNTHLKQVTFTFAYRDDLRPFIEALK